ncbi:hypothetical protein WJX72_000426 [[Myrmecia] bisecta]|uniref:Uncharacterized protein n=1 Tax=[Myrmecia] bisecta TaxID=41462 RepID=A0AAW1PCT8_9CHLO
MATTVPYVVFTLGDAQLHQLHTPSGRLFVMGEVATELFQENPTAFLQALRAGRYAKVICEKKEVMTTIAKLGLPVESKSTSAVGVMLLPAETVEALLTDKRKVEMVQPFKLALLKLASQEAARLMAAGRYESALPVALDAVQQGQVLFQPLPALQLFPLYLLAAQAQLGLKRGKPCEDFLGLASWLAFNNPAETNHVMRSQLNRLYGQLYAMQANHQESLRAFAEDVYHCALEYGPEDVRTSLGYYNLAKVFQALNETDKCLRCSDQVMAIWFAELQRVVLGAPGAVEPKGKGDAAPPLPLGKMQLLEVVEMLEDITRIRASASGAQHHSVADAHFVCALALIYLHEVQKAATHLDFARSVYMPGNDAAKSALVAQAMHHIQSPLAGGHSSLPK